jgi:DNA modification methylase
MNKNKLSPKSIETWIQKIHCEKMGQMIIKEIPNESIDCIVTDPPYGYSFMGKDWDKAVPSVEWWKECLRVLKSGAFMFVMSAPRQDLLSQMIVQVGRGNRYNGLITPCRPMTMEAYYGKNNKNHIGKIYQKWAFEKAKELYEQTGKYTEVILIGKIGKPITDYEIYTTHKSMVGDT